MKRQPVRIRLGGMVFLLLAIVTFLSCSKQQPQFRFVFLTDIHLRPEGFATEGFERAIDFVNRSGADFVITGGDLIFDALGQSFPRADSLFNLYQSYQQKFAIPVYNTIGNHEVFGLYRQSGVDSTHPEYGKRMFANRLGGGKTYRSFDHKGWHFMLLDGIGIRPDHTYYGYIDSLQMEWIRQDLAGVDPQTPIVVSLHIPFYSIFYQVEKDPTVGNPPGLVITNANEVLSLFKGHNLKLVLSGHLHWSEEIRFRGVAHINVAAVSGAWWRGAYRGFGESLAVIDVSGDTFSWKLSDYGWHYTAEAAETREEQE